MTAVAVRLRAIDPRYNAPAAFITGLIGAAVVFGAVQLFNNPALFFQTFMKSMGLGSIYALIALGFVLIFKATQTVNFAQGALAATGALFVAFLVYERRTVTDGQSVVVRDGHIPFTSIGNPIDHVGGPQWVHWALSVAVAPGVRGGGRTGRGAAGHTADDRRTAVLGGGDNARLGDRLS